MRHLLFARPAIPTDRLKRQQMNHQNEITRAALQHSKRRGPGLPAMVAVLTFFASFEAAAQTNAGIALDTIASWRGPHQHLVAGASLVTPTPSLLDAAGTNVDLPDGANVADVRLFWWGSGDVVDAEVDLRAPNGTLQNISVDVDADCGVINPKPGKSFWQCAASATVPDDQVSGEYRLEGLTADISAPYNNPCPADGDAACSEYIAAFALVWVYTDPAETSGDRLPARFTQLASGFTYLQYIGTSVSAPLAALRVSEDAQGRMSVVALEGDPDFPAAGCNSQTNGMDLLAGLDIVDGQGRPLCEFVTLCDGACVDESVPGRLSADSTLLVLQNDQNVPGILFNGSVAGSDESMHALDVDVFEFSGILPAGTYEDLRIGVQTGEDAMMLALNVVTIDEADQDGDGLSDAQEEELGTDPTEADSDGDQILDGLEVFGGAPGLENNSITDPLLADTDGDGLCDGGDDVTDAANPCVSGEDTNGNGIRDPGETDPSKADSDEDGLSDGTEVLSDYPGPFDNYAQRPGAQTNPLNPDSDGDGVIDGDEDLNANGRFEPQSGETNPTGDDDEGDAGSVDADGGSGGGNGPGMDAGNPPVTPPADAGQGPVCGDGICQAEETADSCSTDCGDGAEVMDAGPESEKKPTLDVAGSAFYTGCGAFDASQAGWPVALLLAWPLARRRRRSLRA